MFAKFVNRLLPCSYKEFNVKRHYQTKHANAYDELSGSDRAEQVKQLEAVWAQNCGSSCWPMSLMKILAKQAMKWPCKF